MVTKIGSKIKDTIFYEYAIWHVLISDIFAISSTLKTPNLGMFGGVAHPLDIFYLFLLL